MQISENPNFQREPESVQIQNSANNMFRNKKNNQIGDPSVILSIQRLQMKQNNLKVEFPDLDVNLFTPD